MDLSNYAGLQDAVPQYLNRDDIDILPVTTGIQLCESKLNRVLRTTDMQVELQGNITVGTTTLTLPADFLAPLTFTVRNVNGYNWTPIKFVTEFEANKRRQHNGWAHIWNTQPWYTIFGNTIELVGVHSSSTDIPYTLRYYQAIPALSVMNTTNWLLTKSPDLYLYGTMLELEAFLMNDERIPLWKAAYDMIIQDMVIASEHARFPMGGKNVTVRSFG